MKRLFLALTPLALISGGCANLAAGAADVVSSPGAPLTKTTIDEKALTLAAKTTDALALSASALVRAHVITAGSPTALSMASWLDELRGAVNAAATAREAGNATTYAEALNRAEAAVAQIKALIPGGS